MHILYPDKTEKYVTFSKIKDPSGGLTEKPKYSTIIPNDASTENGIFYNTHLPKKKNKPLVWVSYRIGDVTGSGDNRVVRLYPIRGTNGEVKVISRNLGNNPKSVIDGIANELTNFETLSAKPKSQQLQTQPQYKDKVIYRNPEAEWDFLDNIVIVLLLIGLAYFVGKTDVIHIDTFKEKRDPK